jgi:hypothetical protein
VPTSSLMIITGGVVRGWLEQSEALVYRRRYLNYALGVTQFRNIFINYENAIQYARNAVAVNWED